MIRRPPLPRAVPPLLFAFAAALALVPAARAATYTVPSAAYADLASLPWYAVSPGDVIVLGANDNSLDRTIDLSHLNGAITIRSATTAVYSITPMVPAAGDPTPPAFSLFTTNSASLQSRITLERVTLAGNQKTGTGVIDGLGGAIFNTGGQAIVGNGGQLSGNVVTAQANDSGWGGGLYTTGDAVISGLGLYGNKALADGWFNAGQGGGVYAAGDLTFDSGSWADANSATNIAWGMYTARGGALYVGGNATFGTGASLTYNQATVGPDGEDSAQGGALYAVGSAVFGQGATLRGNWVQAGASGDIRGAAASGRGGAVHTRSGGVAFGDNVIVTLNEARGFGDTASADMALGGAIYAGGPLTGSAYGGAAFWAGDNILFVNNGATVTGSSPASARGGAVYAAGAVQVGDNALFTDNYARMTGFGSESAWGGAIHARDSIVVGADATFRQNTAIAGGGVGSGRGGALSSSAGGVAIGVGALFEGNRASASSTAADAADNRNAGQGGAVYAGGAVIIGDNSVFRNNVAYAAAGMDSGQGGAAYAGGNATVGVGVSFTGNQADGSGDGAGLGGAVLAKGDAVFGADTLIQDNLARLRAAGAASFSDGARGGGVYAGGSAAFGDGATLADNRADGSGDGAGGARGWGGGVYAGRGLSFAADATLTGNSALGGASNDGGFGGGAYVSTGTAVFGERARILNNTASGAGLNAGRGGGVAAGAFGRLPGSVTLGDGARVSGNTAENSGGLGGGGLGGGVFAQTNARFENDVEISGNRAIAAGGTDAGRGGGVYTETGGVRFGERANVSANIASAGVGAGSGQGGGVWSGTSMEFGDDAVVDGNQAISAGGAAAGLGGGAYTATGPLTTGANARFSNNRASGNGDNSARGGGLYAASGDAILGAGAVLTNNSAIASGGAGAGQGGAVYAGAPGSNVVFGSGALASGNIAQGPGADGGLGGGVYAAGNLSVGENAAFTGNSATGGGGLGGAAWVGGSAAILGGAAFVGNSASAAGGALYMAGAGTTTLNADTADILFQGNTAGGAANAIYFENAGPTTLHTAAAAGRMVNFEDPIANNAAKGTLSVVVDGPGTTRFADHQSAVLADTRIQGGTFWLDRGAVYGMGDPAGNAGLGGTFAIYQNGKLRLDANLDGTHAQLRAAEITVAGDLRLELSGTAAFGAGVGEEHLYHDLIAAEKFINLEGLNINNALMTAWFVENPRDLDRPILHVITRDIADVYEIDGHVDVWRLNPHLTDAMRNYLTDLYNGEFAPSAEFTDFARQLSGVNTLAGFHAYRSHIGDIRRAIARRTADFHVMAPEATTTREIYDPFDAPFAESFASTEANARPDFFPSAYACGGLDCGLPSCGKCSGPATGAAWVYVSQNWIRQDDHGDNWGYKYDPTAFALGYDHRWGPLMAGGAVQYARGGLASKDDGRTRTDIDAVLLAGYASYAYSRWHVDFGIEAGMGWNDIATTFPFWGLSTAGQYDAWALGADMEAGYTLVWEDGCGRYPTLVTPRLGAAVDHIRFGGFTETGPLSLARRFDGADWTVAEASLGIKIEKSFQAGSTRWTPEAELIYACQFGQTAPSGSAEFAALPGRSWGLRGIDAGAHTGRLNLGMRGNTGERWEMSFHYDLEVRRRYYGHQLRGGVAYAF